MSNDIAIIGLSGRFPGASSVEEFWGNLCAGRESITLFDDDDLEDRFDDQTRQSPNYVKARPILDGVERFDADFFAMHAKEAELTDPQHRIFLECAWEALEDGGYDPAAYEGAIGVFAGCSMNTYFLHNVCRDRRTIETFTSSYQVGCYPELVGASQDFLATRVSYKLDLKGPSLTLQTACSTSLLAVTQACQSLLLYQADMALAGGVSVTFPQKRGYLHQEGGMVSKDGHCRPFDADASGTIFGSGAGIVLLKRLEDALADRDHIYAVIRGWGVSNDGASKVGFTAPSVDGQAAAIEMALAMAELSGRDIGYVECHGTATPLGDPIEIAGLTKAFRASTQERQFCAIGSVKGNIGHLDAAAGIAGLIKTALSLTHRRMPASLHFERANPQIDFAATPFYVNRGHTEWPSGTAPCRAGVSALGVGGTNVHVVLEEPPAKPGDGAKAPRNDFPYLLPLSARSEAALGQARARLASHLRQHPEQNLADIAHTLQTGRRGFKHRCVILCRDREEAATKLEGQGSFSDRSGRSWGKNPPVVFMFPGQGSQYPDMGRGLYGQEPEFRRHVDLCAGILKPHMAADLRDFLYPSGDPATARQKLLSTAIAQPAIFTTEYALAQLWMSWGIRPAAMIGHSIGELVAAVLAGVFSLPDALALVAERGRLIQKLPGGSMLAVRLPAAEIEPLLEPPLTVAAVNGPSLCVVAGPHDAVKALEKRLEAREMMTRRLHTSHAFHSPMMDPIVEPLRAHLATMAMSKPALSFVSGATGDWVRGEDAVSPDYWARHVREPVQFGSGISKLDAAKWPIMLEVGPGNALGTLVLQASRGLERVVLSSLPDATEPCPERDAMLEALGSLWKAGVTPDWGALDGGDSARVSLPTYPFQRVRYWIDPPARAEASPAGQSPRPAAERPSLMNGSAAESWNGVGMSDEPEEAPATSDEAVAGNERTKAIAAQLVAIIEELSGESLQAAASASFLEMGFDSLFLSQVTQRIQRKFDIKIQFRQLLGDYATIPTLAAYLEQQTALSSAPMKNGSAARRIPAGANGAAELVPNSFELDTSESATTPSVTGDPPRPSRFDLYKARNSSAAGDLTPTQRERVDALIGRYVARTAGSKQYTQKYRTVLADPRAAAGFSSNWKEMVYPIVSVRSRGSRLWDVDGNEYIDLVNGYGQTAFGHLPDFIAEAIKEQLEKGFVIGPQAELAGEVAALVSELTGNERVAFCNTGSEAVMAALRVARTVTGRDRVVMFNGAYHGQFDEALVKGISRQGAPRTLPVAAGIPESAVSKVIVLDYATPAALRWIEDNAGDLAAVVVEPVQSRHPDLQPVEFLRAVRRITEAAGAALVMDEVVTGFRVHPGGMQALTGIRPDLVTYGKVVGGGMPIGILAGKSKFMDALDGGMWSYGDDSTPSVGVTFFAGTFVRHPLTLAAARAVLEHLKEQGTALHADVAARTAALVAQLNDLFRVHGLGTRIETFASWFYFDLTGEHPLARLLFYLLRERGIYVQDGFPCFLTTAHAERDFQSIAEAFEKSLDELSALGIFSARPAAPAPAVSEPAVNLSAADAAEPSVPFRPTESQVEIWLAAQLGDEASCAFNESMTLRLKGALDEHAFQEAWNRVLARHDALRACFGRTGETVRIVEPSGFRYPSVDVSGERDPEAILATLIERDGRTPFDLVEGPLIRGQLARLSAEASAFIFTAHHIVCDGWSANVILEELATFYAALHRGRTCELKAPPTFSRYARLKQTETADELREIESFWLGQFERPIAPLELPLDRPRSASRSFKGGTRTGRIEADLYRAVKDAGARQRCTLFVMLLAAFKILLGRLADQEDIVVGVPTAGQSLLEDQNLVGQCVNFLPIRSEWSQDMRLCDYLAIVRERVIAAYEHQNYTLGTLVRKLAPPREPGRLPLTEIQFNLERLTQTLSLPDLEIGVEPNPKAHVNFDLFLNVIESDSGLRIDCDYNSDLWDAATVDRWLGYYGALLEAMVAEATRPVAQLCYLPAAERHRLLVELNRTAQDYPRDAGLHTLFEAQAMARPDAIAAMAGDSTITYELLSRRANKLANHLRSRVEGKSGLIGVAVGRSLDMPTTLLAVLKAGHAYLPLDPSHPPARLRGMLAEAGVAALVTDNAAGAALVSADTPVIHLTEDTLEIAAMPDSSPSVTVSADDLAYVIYTSGSTGVPKGVEITHRSVVNLLSAMAREPGLGPDDVLLGPTTIAFDIAALELFLPLSVGARTVIATVEEARDGFALRERLETSHATVMQATPATWRLLLEAGFQCPAGFKMLCGGEALPRGLANELLQGGGELWNMYGPTEATIWSSCARVTPGQGPITVGRQPIANTRFYILDNGDQLAPIGKIGQLHLGGEGVARGYFKRPELTAEKFIADPFQPGRLYRTGDLARRLPNGEIQILGRRDRQVKLRGFRIELDEIEAVLSQGADLSAAVVTLREDATGMPQLVAYFMERPGASPSPAALRKLLEGQLPDYMIPTVWTRLDELPRTANGKLDRAALPRANGPPPDTDERVGPRTSMQGTLAKIWRQVLGLDRIGITDDLLDLGADSIHLFQITARANREGIGLSAKQLMQCRTIEELSRHLGDGEMSGDAGMSLQSQSSRRQPHDSGATGMEEMSGSSA